MLAALNITVKTLVICQGPARMPDLGNFLACLSGELPDLGPRSGKRGI
jgi:hypothetical protein